MDKLTVFLIVVLLAGLRGFLQRRKVKEDLEERLAKARSRGTVRPLPGRLKSEDD